MTNKDFDNKLIEMTQDEFDDYMVKSYPDLFRQRHLPATETCMCWGFEVGKGWRPTLNSMCEKITAIIRAYPSIHVEFTQIKEKYGSGRFYYNSWHDESAEESRIELILSAIGAIDDIIERAERAVDSICAITGEQYYTKITYGGWVYDICPEVFIAKNPEVNKKIVENILAENKLIEQISYELRRVPLDEIRKMLDQIKAKKKELV
jgi:hypothetical protein